MVKPRQYDDKTTIVRWWKHDSRPTMVIRRYFDSENDNTIGRWNRSSTVEKTLYYIALSWLYYRIVVFSTS